MAKYPHIVKCNGVWYDAGEDVPKTEDMAVDENSLPYSDNDIEFETHEKRYTKSEINRMKTAELQELARNSGIEDSDEMTGQELKEYLLNIFGL